MDDIRHQNVKVDEEQDLALQQTRNVISDNEGAAQDLAELQNHLGAEDANVHREKRDLERLDADYKD